MKLILWVKMKLRKVIHICLQISVIGQIDLVRMLIHQRANLALLKNEKVLWM